MSGVVCECDEWSCEIRVVTLLDFYILNRQWTKQTNKTNKQTYCIAHFHSQILKLCWLTFIHFLLKLFLCNLDNCIELFWLDSWNKKVDCQVSEDTSTCRQWSQILHSAKQCRGDIDFILEWHKRYVRLPNRSDIVLKIHISELQCNLLFIIWTIVFTRI